MLLWQEVEEAESEREVSSSAAFLRTAAACRMPEKQPKARSSPSCPRGEQRGRSAQGPKRRGGWHSTRFGAALPREKEAGW